MAHVTLKEVIEATGGRLLGSYSNLDTMIGAVEQNTRNLVGGSMFLPYIGENVDAHTFISETLESGCIGCLTQEELPEYRDDKFYVFVPDVSEAVWKIIGYMISSGCWLKLGWKFLHSSSAL